MVLVRPLSSEPTRLSSPSQILRRREVFFSFLFFFVRSVFLIPSLIFSNVLLSPFPAKWTRMVKESSLLLATTKNPVLFEIQIGRTLEDRTEPNEVGEQETRRRYMELFPDRTVATVLRAEDHLNAGSLQGDLSC